MMYKALKPSLYQRLEDIIIEVGGFDCYDEIIEHLYEYAECRLTEYIEHNSTSILTPYEMKTMKAYVKKLKEVLLLTREFQDVID